MERAATAAKVLAYPAAGARAARRSRAVSALLASEGSWTPALTGVLLDSLVEDPSVLDAVIAVLARRNAREPACGLAEAALLHACSHGGTGLYEAFWAAVRLCEDFRSAPARLLPALTTVLTWRPEHPCVHPWVASVPGDAAELVGGFGADAAPAANALFTLAHDTASPENADRALAALIRIGDDRAPSLLAEHLPDRPRALRSAAEHGLPLTPALLKTIREHLRTTPKRPSDEGRFVLLLALLRSWGPQAQEAVPELCDVLSAASARKKPDPASPSEVASFVLDDRVPGQLVKTLGVVGGCGDGRERAEAALRRAASGKGARERLEAARALRRLTGDAGPLLGEIEALLGGKGPQEHRGLRPDAAEACRELGAEARPLLPVLLPLLECPKPRRLLWLVDVAVAVWRLTGEAERVLPVLAAALASPAAAAKAVLAVRELGPAASVLAGPVAGRLYDLPELPETVRTLIRICPAGHPLPEGCSPTRLIDLLLTCAGEARNPAPSFELIAELGVEHLTATHRALLHDYAASDRRVPRRHSPPDIPADDVLRTAARALLARLPRQRPPAESGV